MSKLTDWLGKKSGITRIGDPFPHYLSREPTHLELLGELIYKNGGKWILDQLVPPKPGGPYGRMGLTAEEVLLFCEIRGFLNGMMECQAFTTEELFEVVKNEIDRVVNAIVVPQIILGK